MCGIVGLHLKTAVLRPRLGELATLMLGCMASRGPDSAGVALYDDDRPGRGVRYSVRAQEGFDWGSVAARLTAELGADVLIERRGDGVVLVSDADEHEFRDRLAATEPGAVVVGYGQAMEIFKDVGAPAEICRRYGVPGRAGYQALGHTRMATESAVTTNHSHPFAPAPDLGLVHNGSFSNYATVRRRLAAAGVHCVTDNDSEVAARYVAHQMSLGADLGDALRMVLKELDGFFTLLVGTRTQFAVVRDSFACKPLVVAETGDYVAVASEYQALAGLPGVGAAEVFEPMPEEVHVWTR